MTIPLCRVIDRGPNKTCAACCPINGHRTLLVPCSRSAGSPVDAGTDHGEWAARIDVRGAQLSVQALAAGESLAAFDGRCIPKPPQRGCRVGDGTPGRLARLGATPDFHHGLLVPGRYCRLAQGQRYSNVNSLNRLLRLPVVQI